MSETIKEMSEDSFEKWWDAEWMGERESARYRNVKSIAYFAYTAGYSLAINEAGRIAEQCNSELDSPPSIGRDHGKHHRAGLQRMANSIANAIRQKSTN